MVEEYKCPISDLTSGPIWLIAMYRSEWFSSGLEAVAREVLNTDYKLTFSSVTTHLIQCGDCRSQYDAEIEDISNKVSRNNPDQVGSSLDPVSAWLVATDKEKKRSHLQVVSDR